MRRDEDERKDARRVRYLERPDGMTLQEVADLLGVTKSCVKKIQDGALWKLRRALEEG